MLRTPSRRRLAPPLSAVLSVLALGGLVALSGVPKPAQTPEPYPWRIERLADGVYAALQPSANRFDDSNATILVGSESVVVIDAQADAAAVRDLIRRIGEITAKPVTRVTNTHWHGDHTQGNAIYREIYGPAVQIFGHGSLARDVPERAGEFVAERIAYLEAELPGARERLEQGVFRDGTAMSEQNRSEQAAVLEQAAAWLQANRGAEFLPPDTTYGERLDATWAGHRVQILHFRGHTRGDTVVLLPDERVLITGDLLDDLPFVGHGYPSEWVAALESLRQLEFDVVVPGHGPVFQGTEHLDLVQEFLRALVGQVRSAVEADRDLESTRSALYMDPYRERLGRDEAGLNFFDQVLGDAIERAWLEARGELEN